MPLPRAALKTGAAGQVRFGGDVIADGDRGDAGAQLHDLTTEFMTNDMRRMNPTLCPAIPPIDMGVRSTQRRGKDADQHLPLTGSGIGDMMHGEPRLGGSLYERAHRLIMQCPVENAK